VNLGIFGGTFDPIHYGHLRMAEEARERLCLDRILFVPNRVSPFKLGAEPTPGPVRAEMVRAAIEGNDRFALDTRELDRPGPSYTIDTVREIRDRYPEARLFFLTGADAVRDLPQWREPAALLDLLTLFAAAARPGVRHTEIVEALRPDWSEKVVFLQMPELAIAATDLRNRISEGRSIRYLTPMAVVELIERHGLYRGRVAAR
jgi:nicotinate-nucleotide adenylyltransferase